MRGAPGRTFPARPKPGRALKRTQARAAELASTRDTVAQRRRRISSCDAVRSRTIRPLRTDQTRTYRAHFEAPPPTDDAAARATRPRLSLDRWPRRTHAPQYEGSQGQLPRGELFRSPAEALPSSHAPYRAAAGALSGQGPKTLRHLTKSQLSSFWRRACTRRRQKPQSRGSLCLCAERREKAKRAGRLSAATALLFSYYLRGCSRAKSVRTSLIRNF